MKPIYVIVICLAFVCTSCDDRAKNASMKANAASRVFVEKMNKGQTTREQEQEFIRIVGDLTFELDRALRGTEKAEATKKNAVLVGQGIDPNAPLKIFDDVKPKEEPVTP